jgi:NAD(P)-dependent dehydrogenase (short-subunit alcohol dehydrogenase family)
MPPPTEGQDHPRKVWFITGCSSGLGMAIAERALEGGAVVFTTARSVSTLDQHAQRYPETCRPLEVDVTDAEQVRAAFRAVEEQAGRIDVVVNNAGYGLIGALEECSDQQIARNFDTIVMGAIRVLRGALPLMRAQKSGRIINISAAAAISNYAGFSIYGAAKFALEGISESLTAEVKPLGIKVTLVQPGPFRTDFVSRSLERASTTLEDYAATAGKFRTFLEKMDGQQPGDPAKAAEAIFQLAEAENPPLRLVLGKYAIEKVERVLKGRQRELETWRNLGLSVDG